MKSLGIIAGDGMLPLCLAHKAKDLGYTPFILNFTHHPVHPDILQYPHKTVALGALSEAIQALKDVGARDIVMIGAFKRPDLKALRPDWEGTKLLAKIGLLGALGDDSLLTLVIQYLDGLGFKVHGIQEFMDDLLASSGVWGDHNPDEVALGNIAYGVKVSKALGELDVGQSVIVQDGVILGVEGVEGTNQLIQRCASYKTGPGGILVKVAKPKQERRADLPTIGPDTLEKVIAAGLEGIAVEAGSTLVIDQSVLIQQANKHGIFLVGV